MISENKQNSDQPAEGSGALQPKPGSTVRDRKLAERCRQCPVCNRARRKQRGVAYWFVKNIEGGYCPYCAAYERVYGRKAHEPAAR